MLIRSIADDAFDEVLDAWPHATGVEHRRPTRPSTCAASAATMGDGDLRPVPPGRGVQDPRDDLRLREPAAPSSTAEMVDRIAKMYFTRTTNGPRTTEFLGAVHDVGIQDTVPALDPSAAAPAAAPAAGAPNVSSF